MPHTIDLGLMALATSETIPLPLGQPMTSTLQPYCDTSAISHSSSTPSPDTTTYSRAFTPVHTQIAIRRAGLPAITGTHNSQEEERNASFRTSFLRSTLFCAPFRCSSNPDRLPVMLCGTEMPRASFHRTVCYTFVQLKPINPISRPTLVFPPASRCDVVEAGMSLFTNTRTNAVELLEPKHAIALVGCTGMLALLSTLGCREAA